MTCAAEAGRAGRAGGLEPRTGGWRGGARLGAALALALAAPPLTAQVSGEVPDDLREVGIEQRMDAQLPLELELTDENGRRVRLGDYFRPERPVVLTLVYYRCPMLCGIVLDGLVATLEGIDWVPGGEFEIVTVSIDPTETTPLARQKKQSYLQALGRPGAERGWHFLTGSQEAIRELTDTVGFGYKYLPERGEYAHSAALIVLTPEGRVARYLVGVKHDPRTLRLSLVEAADGKIGSPVDQFLLYCYRYDEREGQYTPVAMRIMRLGGSLTLIVLGAVLVRFWRREAAKRRRT